MWLSSLKLSSPMDEGKHCCWGSEGLLYLLSKVSFLQDLLFYCFLFNAAGGLLMNCPLLVCLSSGQVYRC